MRFRELLRNKSLTRSELALASYLLQHAEEVSHLTVRELAQASFTSPSTVMRLTKKAGFSSFSELKVELARQLSNEGEFDFRTADFPEFARASDQQVVRMLGIMKRTAANETTQLLLEQDLRPVVDALEAAPGVTVLGIGSSGAATRVFTMNLEHLGWRVMHSTDHTDCLVWARACPRDELFVICSYSGESPVLKVARRVRERGMPLVSITADAPNTLADLSDWNVRIPEIEGRFNTDRVAAFCSAAETAQVLDVLYALLFSRHYAENVAHSKYANERPEG